MTIRFGTDGWRGIIADDFTFDNVRIVAQAVADLIHEEGRSGSSVPVGYDGRFLSRRFAESIAAVLEGNGIPTILPDTPITTPMLSCQVVAGGAPLGIGVTASHNPPHYNGVKIKAAFGGSALPELTARIEELVGRRAPRVGRPPERRHPFLPAYVPRLVNVVNLELIKKAPLRVVVDSMHGSGSRILEGLVRGGKLRITTLRGDSDVLFGGVQPDPRPDLLGPLADSVRRHRAHLGIATDGDADRIGVCDEKGRPVSPLQIFPLIALHLLETKGWRGTIAKTFANTLLAERIAQRYDLPFHDLPIGFKHIARLMLEQDVLIGGEESGGIGVKRYLPERDGILIGLLLIEMLSTGERKLSRRIASMEAEFGRYFFRRVDLNMPVREGRQAVRAIHKDPPARLGGLTVRGIDTLDGVKLLFGDEGWILFRPSGTEPLLRVYCEARSERSVDALIRSGLTRLKKRIG
ncbi:MAG: phosphoglucomutase/phosphomannomutase family protein [Acidobacteriota bacterium]